MTARHRNVREGDLPAVLALNESVVPHVNSVPMEQLRWFMDNAFVFRVAELGNGLGGFLVALTPEADYASPNFRWFVDRRSSFVYVDRVVVSPAARRLGLARRFYEDLARAARGRAEVLTCEVNTRPRNEDSLHFHRSLGFSEVGRQETEGGLKEVSLMERPLSATVL